MERINALLQPGRIGNMQLKNRIVYSSMSLRSTDGLGHMTEAAIESLVYRAKQAYSPGLITFPGAMPFHAPNAPCGLEIHIGDREATKRFAKAVKRVRINDVKVMLSIYARGTRLQDGSHANVGPSSMLFGFEPYPTRALTLAEIKERIQDFVDATCRAREAGFDAVLIHACSGKMISMFLSPYSNHRDDAYGGSVEGRSQFLVEILQGVRRKVGDDYPLLVQLGVDDCLGKYGLTLDEGLQVAKRIEPYIDAIWPSTGTQEKIWNISVGYGHAPGYMREVTAAVRAESAVPVVAMAKLGDPEMAEEVLTSGQADFVALGRPLMVDPQWIEKAATGTGRIRPCIGCVNCLTYNSRKEIVPTQVSCTMNPGLLREEAYELTSAETTRDILVAGAGLAGVTAALILSRRGHRVTLAEKSSAIGGQWRVAAKGADKADYRKLLSYIAAELEDSAVELRLNTMVDRAFIEALKPDEVVLATGAQPKTLPFTLPEDAVPVVQGNDVIMGKVTTGPRVVVIGGRYIGLEVAAQLAGEGKNVSIVDMDDFGKGANPRLIGPYRDAMVAGDVKMYPRCAVLCVTDAGVDIVHMNSLLTLAADTVVLCVGTRPDDALVETLEQLQLPYYQIGDCKRIGDALYAIRDGAELGRLL